MPTKKEQLERFYDDIQNNPHKIIERAGRINTSNNFRNTIPLRFFNDPHIWENDLTLVTANEIIGKIREFLNSEPVSTSHVPFLYYMAYFPVSMCKRSISPLLKTVIGFHYGFGLPTRKDMKEIPRVSMEELAQIFGRSKATIHECIKEREKDFAEFQEESKRSIELDTKAERELIEERKARLREDKALETTLTEKTTE